MDRDFEVGSRIKESRLGLRITQAQLASLTGIPQQHLSLIERGACDPNLKTLSRILDALGLELQLAHKPYHRQIAGRLEQLRAFNDWETSHQRPLAAHAALELSSGLADWLRRGGAEPPEDWDAKADQWARWRAVFAQAVR